MQEIGGENSTAIKTPEGPPPSPSPPKATYRVARTAYLLPATCYALLNPGDEPPPPPLWPHREPYHLHLMTRQLQPQACKNDTGTGARVTELVNLAHVFKVNNCILVVLAQVHACSFILFLFFTFLFSSTEFFAVVSCYDPLAPIGLIYQIRNWGFPQT